MCNGSDPGAMTVDHIDGNRNNNAPSNLRLATKSENQMNRLAKIGRAYKGTQWHKVSGRWTATIVKRLGYYDTEEEAALAYQAAAEILQKEFAVHLSRPAARIAKGASPMDLIGELLKGVD
jgi:hypothetical protein